MKKHHIALIVWFLIVITSHAIHLHSSPHLNAYHNLAQADFGISKYAQVENITFCRDVATFHLLKGTIYFFEPDTIKGNEVVTGALFIGEGTFDFIPPTDFELKQLKRFYKSEIVNDSHYQQAFKVLFLRFADSTFNEIARIVHLHEAPVPKKVKQETAYCRKYLSEWNDEITYYILSSFLWSSSHKFFYAHLFQHRAQSVFFVYNPHRIEEVSFQNRESELNYRAQTICRFHKKSDYKTNKDLTNKTKDQIRIDRYFIESQVNDQGTYSARAKVFFKPIKDDVVLLPFGLAEKLEVQEVLDENNFALDFIMNKEPGVLIVAFPEPLSKALQTHISIQYEGDFLLKKWDCFYPPPGEPWYPHYSSGKRAEFELTFNIPSSYDCISVGEKTIGTTDLETRTMCWHQKKPIEHPYFLIGKLLYERRQAYGDVPVTVVYTKKSHAEIVEAFKKRKIKAPDNIEACIAADVANSIKLFSHVFGDYPLEKLHVIQGPDYHTVSLPGLVLLPWYRFQFLTDLGRSEMVRAHEVAHQWWGNAVECKTYHDVWLSEGFAQYAGIWYLQWATQDNELYFKNIKNWQDQIFEYREFAIKNGTEPGPIWLGYRLRIPDTESEYSLFVYRKAAYVLHMLRNMLMDLNTMEEDAFITLLQDFYMSYKGKEASTEDFKRMVEHHIGENMDWFFEQWIYGTDIPTYRVSYRAFEQPDGKFIIKLRVKQEEVPDDFKMYVPITIKFKGDQSARLRFTIDKPYEEFSIPSPLKPEKIIFNDFNSVLADVKYEKFKE